jgi:hypothetical protein
VKQVQTQPLIGPNVNSQVSFSPNYQGFGMGKHPKKKTKTNNQYDEEKLIG